METLIWGLMLVASIFFAVVIGWAAYSAHRIIESQQAPRRRQLRQELESRGPQPIPQRLVSGFSTGLIFTMIAVPLVGFTVLFIMPIIIFFATLDLRALGVAALLGFPTFAIWYVARKFSREPNFELLDVAWSAPTATDRTAGAAFAVWILVLVFAVTCLLVFAAVKGAGLVQLAGS